MSPKIKTDILNNEYESFNKNEKIYIIDDNENFNVNQLDLIGVVKSSSTGTNSGCGYSDIINDFKEVAINNGANIIKIDDLKKPNFSDFCYKIKAHLYRS